MENWSSKKPDHGFYWYVNTKKPKYERKAVAVFVYRNDQTDPLRVETETKGGLLLDEFCNLENSLWLRMTAPPLPGEGAGIETSKLIRSAIVKNLQEDPSIADVIVQSLLVNAKSGDISSIELIYDLCR